MRLKHYYNNVKEFLFKPVSIASLSLFRVGFGIICFFESLRLSTEIDGNSPNDIVSFEILFKYHFFEWVELLPHQWLVGIIIIMKVTAVFIAVGFLYRLSVLLYLLGYAYFFLVEMSHYNNHYYLLILLLGFLLFVDANRLFSIDALWKKKSSSLIPNWQLVLFKFQVVWVYLCAGLVKLNYDWLSGRTMKTAIFSGADFADDPFFQSQFFVYFYSWTGVIFDVFIGFLLLFRKTRILALLGIVVFHFINSKTLTIGVFPFLMIWITILFFHPNWPVQWLSRITKREIYQNTKKEEATAKTWIVNMILLFVIIQLFLPARHHLIKGRVDWTGEGVMFAWRMKSAGRSGIDDRYNFYLYDKATLEEIKVSIRLSNRQKKFLLYKPVLALQIRDHLLEKIDRKKKDVILEMDVLCSINGSEYKPLFVRNANICEYELKYLKHNSFITLKP